LVLIKGKISLGVDGVHVCLKVLDLVDEKRRITVDMISEGLFYSPRGIVVYKAGFAAHFLFFKEIIF